MDKVVAWGGRMGAGIAVLGAVAGWAVCGAGCSGAPPGAPTGGGGNAGSPNPCAFTLTGDVSDRVSLNAHLRILKVGFDSGRQPALDVNCLQDPPGSQQSGNFPAFEMAPLTGGGSYTTSGAVPGSGSVTVGARAGGPVFRLVGGDGSAGSCTFSLTLPAAPKIGDRADATFSCVGLTTTYFGAPYVAEVSDGVLGGALEYVE